HLLTDLESADILDRTVRPRLRENNVDLALREGVGAIQRELGGPGSGAPRSTPDAPGNRAQRSLQGGWFFLQILMFLGSLGVLLFAFQKYRRQKALKERHRVMVEEYEKKLGAFPDPASWEQRRKAQQGAQFDPDELTSYKTHHASVRSALDLYKNLRPGRGLERESQIERDLAKLKKSHENVASLERFEQELRGGASSRILAQAAQELEKARELLRAHKHLFARDTEASLRKLQAGQQVARVPSLKNDPRATAEACLKAAEEEHRKLQDRIKVVEAGPERARKLARQLKQLRSSSQQASAAWRSFFLAYPGETEPSGKSPDAQLTNAEAALRRLEATLPIKGASQVEAFLREERTLQGALQRLENLLREAPDLSSRRASAEREAPRVRGQVEGLLLSVQEDRLNFHGVELRKKAELQYNEAVRQLEAREKGSPSRALEQLREAERNLQKASKLHKAGPKITASSNLYGSSSSSDGGFDEGGYSGHESSSSSYDSSSSSSYDSSSSSSYDSSSGSSSDGGGSSGGGDFGGGGSSSDW
nr:hypothetical protein [Polyangiaceae bacterium]